MPGHRVALLEPAGRGGICHYTRGLAGALARHGVEVALFTARDWECDAQPAAAPAPPFRVERCFDRWRTSPRAVLRALQEFRPELLHLQGGTHPLLHLGLALAAKRATRAPLVVTAHDVVPKNATWSDALACRALYRAADRIVVHGQALADEMTARFPATRGKVRVIAHGDYEFLAPPKCAKTTKTPRASATRPTLLFFGYLHEEKGLPDLIDALPAVARELPQLRVVIAGTPELDVAPLQARARALGVDGAIDWRLRYVGDAERAELFAAATAVVLPYRKASQSGVAFLAGAFERPLVATRVGALPELVEDGRNGVLVPPGAPRELASGILRLLRDPAQARKMGREHRRRCRAHGSWEEIAAQTAALHRELLPAHARANAASVADQKNEGKRRVRRSDHPAPFVSVVMPVRDEEAAIAGSLGSLLAQDYPRDRFEVVVVDGRSRDATRMQVRAAMTKDARVRLLDNPGRIVSTALNLGFARARGTIVVRADGHARYAPDYLRAVVRAFAESDADVVGGPMIAGDCRTPFERAVASALASRFGMGGAAFHFDGASGPADSVYLGAFRVDALHRFGEFDEQLVRDEDDEWFARARARGAKVRLDARIRSTYQPRKQPGRLLRQYFEYGLFKPAALRKVRGSLRLRQLVPSLLLLALCVPLVVGVPFVAAAAAVAYAGALLLASARTAPRERGELRVGTVLRQALVFALMHLGYGAGFLAGLLRRAPDESRAGIAAVYDGYARSAATRRRWSAAQPGQAALVAERDRALIAQVKARFGAAPAPLRVLDLGSGERDLTALFAAHGIAVERVVAADLLADRLAANRAATRIAVDGRRLPFQDGSFDLVVQCTLLSSLRALAGRRVVAAEMVRVCRPGGLLLSYDARLPNPFNWNVRRVSRREHRELFDGAAITFEPLTVVPPLARRLPALARRLAGVEALCAFDLATIENAPAPAAAVAAMEVA